MSNVSLRLPDHIHRSVRELAKREGISVNLFITLAVAEKMSALMTKEYLEMRARRGAREKYEAVLSKTPDVEPMAPDREPPAELLIDPN